ncbi:hypothetical protein CEE45_17435 [Candidatus Heimdallarchaeota archaeon B3_Heim]|nr:MAG: hypothetical protein CEE45_17435 [Candidatus Heimdallarchaeota archaeon B3_Heim]
MKSRFVHILAQTGHRFLTIPDSDSCFIRTLSRDQNTVKYFSAVQYDKDKAERQDLFFQANLLNPKFELILGDFRKRHRWKRVKIGEKKESVKITYWEEKKTDVSIACHMIRDVILNKWDISFLFCADGDLSPPIEVIKEIKPQHKIIAFFPPNTFSYDIKGKANKVILLKGREKSFKNSLFENKIKISDDYTLECPDKWKKNNYNYL